MHPSTLRDRLRAVMQAPPELRREQVPARPCHGVEETLGGEWRSTDVRRSFVVVRRYAPEAPYGRHRVGDFFGSLQRSVDAARLMNGAAAPLPFVFFDLETTGLSGGAGTYAFLVGCARFAADGGFVTEQHLMLDHAGERTMLQAVAADLASAGALVTFNGKSFDAPLVETRYAFHRSDSPCALLPHLDMLHPARRFWAATAHEGCSLGTLETSILGARRVGDVPGSEIPARYFHFVRTGDAGPLSAVLEHNRLDLLSLAGLTARLLSTIEDGPSAARDAHEAFALGRIYERAGFAGRAEQAFERAAAAPGATAALRVVRAEALRALALEARRCRRYSQAAERWQQLVDLPGCPPGLSREASHALAIHHEHRLRDLESARLFALKSLEPNRKNAWGDAVRHRLARIERKMVSERRSLFPSSPSQPACGSQTSAPRTSS